MVELVPASPAQPDPQTGTGNIPLAPARSIRGSHSIPTENKHVDFPTGTSGAFPFPAGTLGGQEEGTRRRSPGSSGNLGCFFPEEMPDVAQGRAGFHNLCHDKNKSTGMFSLLLPKKTPNNFFSKQPPSLQHREFPVTNLLPSPRTPGKPQPQPENSFFKGIIAPSGVFEPSKTS